MPYVQEGYLQEHYSPNLPRKKLYQPKENSDEEISPRFKPKPNVLSKPDENLLIREKNADSFTRRLTLQSNTKTQSVELVTRAIPNCFSVEKKKLKFSPPPEGVRHHTAEKTLSPISNLSSRGRVTRRLLTAMFRGGLKLKERLLVGVSVATVLFTLLLVVDLQMDTGMTGSHLMPSHARVKVGDSQQFNIFRNRLLQKTNR